MDGGCACGEVRYRLKRAPMFVHCCHCTACQRETGSAFAINALIEAAEVEILSGAPAAVPMPTESGAPHDIHRCPDCQVALWSDYGRREVLLFLRAATLDAPGALAPDVHIYTRSRLPWASLPDGVPAFEGYYELAAVWPEESLARRRALGV